MVWYIFGMDRVRPRLKAIYMQAVRVILILPVGCISPITVEKAEDPGRSASSNYPMCLSHDEEVGVNGSSTWDKGGERHPNVAQR
jgi:hypothetical protein